jgi:hypothetical protein
MIVIIGIQVPGTTRDGRRLSTNANTQLQINIDWLVMGAVLIGVAALSAVVILAFQVKRRRR